MENVEGEKKVILSFRDVLLNKSLEGIENPERGNNDTREHSVIDVGRKLKALKNHGESDGSCFNNPLFSDVKLQVNSDPSKTYFAHKVVLVSRSDYFKTLFTSSSQWKENETELVKLEIHDSQVHVFDGFLKFLYTGAIDIDLSKSAIWPLFFLADQFMVIELKRLLSDFVRLTLLQNVTKVDGYSVYVILPYFSLPEAIEFAQYFDFEDVQNVAGTYILTNLESFSEEEFNQLNEGAICGMLGARTLQKEPHGKRRIKHSSGQDHLDLVCKNFFDEFCLLKKALSWIAAEPARTKLADKVLSCVRYGRLEFIGQLFAISRHELVRNSVKLSRIIAMVSQERFFSKSCDKTPSYGDVLAYQLSCRDTKGSEYLFKRRVANENITFHLWDTEYVFDCALG